jgi:hypothetical protein
MLVGPLVQFTLKAPQRLATKKRIINYPSCLFFLWRVEHAVYSHRILEITPVL